MKAALKRNRRVIAIVALFALGTVLGVLTICQPGALANNTFLGSFVSHEIMAFLIVVLTITFASVANIHLQITNMVRSLSAPEAQRRVETELAAPLRREINSSSWLLFWAFVVCALALVLKGQFPENAYVVSFVHATAIVVTTINAIVLYDIHQTIFALAPALTPGTPNAKASDPAGSPPTG
jgi:small basic protein